ncbi:hypothetical protein NPA07_01300 [Mycoplasmopsis caviae]|uniref:Phage-Barnase-EndoU-ColicinE5/D-RelE like nuclease 4 domain-containing protein n=1 Tax=Mycoplasmopsis caviae TaxID=55603 RepID=A0A3P8MDF4_9BACT|nr:hypothetical protein [Mycoplasmopsis caviae]UUD35494.1 hypothetical protein NPA07_01300 [Mycoplasmopsis caviae]VDR41730.1 Uncharacterised protein [Mycoplasmopsis caviae]
MNKENFSQLLTKYIELFYKFKSISILKNASNTNQFDIKLRLILTQKFLLHSIGLQYNKTLLTEYKSNYFKLYTDVKTGKLNYQTLTSNINKCKQFLINKKLRAIEIFVDILSQINENKPLTFAFDYFKLKPKFDIEGVYNHSQLMLVTKANDEGYRCIIYGILGDLYSGNSKEKAHFFNKNKNLMNSVFIPISIKVKSSQKMVDLQNTQSIDIAFLNKRQIQEKEIRV